jgi:hypothetical protein
MGRPRHDPHVGHLESPLGVRPVPVLIAAVFSGELLGLRMSAGRKPRQRLIQRHAAAQHYPMDMARPIAGGPQRALRMVMFGIPGPYRLPPAMSSA